MNGLFALSAGLVFAACSSSVDVPQSVELNYSIYSVNGQSPAVRTQFNVSGDKIAIPRGSFLMHADGTVVEILQYVVTRPSGIDAVATTDTTYGHYAKVDGRYDIRLPNSFGTESFAGSIQPGTDFLTLSQSWKKAEFTVGVDLVFAKAATAR